MPEPQHMKGSPENPFDLVIPQWVAERVEEQEGCSAQEYVDREWRGMTVKVHIVGAWPDDAEPAST